MDDMFSLVPFIASIFTIIVGTLSMAESIRKTGMFKSILCLTLLIMPIIFIQQIIIFSYNNYHEMLRGLTIILLIIIVFIGIYKRKINNINDKLDDEYKLTLVMISINLILSFVYYNESNKLMLSDDAYILELKNYKISVNMYFYLFEHYSASILNFLRTIQLYLLIKYIFLFFVDLLSHINEDIPPASTNKKAEWIIGLIISVILPAPFACEFINDVILLF